MLGVLVLAVVVVWSQVSDKPRAACPPLENAGDQSLLLSVPAPVWVRADWNSNTRMWDIRCNEMDSQGNWPASYPMNAANISSNMGANVPRRRTPAKRRPHEE